MSETPENRFIATVSAALSEYQRAKEAEQTIRRMRARLLNGYWAFSAPAGYRYERRPEHGKLLVRDEPNASVVQEALEGYASGRFQTEADLARFFRTQLVYPKDSTGRVLRTRVATALTTPVYAGYVEHESWGISLRKAQHEGLIGFETYQRIQARLSASRDTLREM